jgi:hypothetical protein
MAQLGRFDFYSLDTAGNSVSSVLVNIYRQGATVNGAQSGASPLTVNVRDTGGIAAADTVFINTVTGTSYSVSSITATTVVLAGFVGTLALSDKDRIVPSNSQPTIYFDAVAGAVATQPLMSSSTGESTCWIKGGSYDVLEFGGGITTRLTTDVRVGAASEAQNVFDNASAVAFKSDTNQALTTAGAKHTSFSTNGTEYAAIGYLGTGIFPRLGQNSNTAAGGAVRFVEGNVFPLTVAGVQAALDECEAVGGGTVYVPAAAGITVSNTSVKVGKGVSLIGMGERMSTATFVASPTANVSAMIENKTQDGTQQFVRVERIQINGNSGAGAVVSAGLKYSAIFVNSTIRDVEVFSCSGNGVLLQNGSAGGFGGLLVQNLIVTSCGSDNIVLKTTTSSAVNVRFDKVESDNPPAGKACLFIDNSTGGASGLKSAGHVITDFYCEISQATAVGILLDSTESISINGVHHLPSGTGAATIRIKNTGGNSTDCSNITIQNVRSGITPIIDDIAHSITVGSNSSNLVTFYTTPTSGSNSQGQVIGLQYQRYAGTIASAAALTLTLAANAEGNLYTISGTTNVTSLANTTARDKGKVIYLLFTGVLTFTHGNNIFLDGAANFVTAANSLLTLVSDGTNWYEVGRKA